MERNRILSEADKTAWVAYARLVEPLPGRSVPPLPSASAPAPLASMAKSEPARTPSKARPARASGLSIGAHPAGLDAATWQRFRTGRLAAARRLDLHGFTAQRAYLAVSHFLKVAHADHVRCVEIVTGRGEGEGGVLRRELPFWLNLPELRPVVLAAAHPHPANPGSVRVLLRRRRSSGS
jgi:DNA-nicking Smr family endonuclease